MPSSNVTIRTATQADAAAAGKICYDAFFTITAAHGFPPYAPSPDSLIRRFSEAFCHPSFYSVVAEAEGKIVGSNVLDERSTIAGVGPITVDPTTQNRGAGRKLMIAVLDRAGSRNFVGVRLVQSAWHNRSLSLYTTLGFDAREPLSLMQGPPLKTPLEGFTVRPAETSDRESCDRLCRRVHGHDRGAELADGIERGSAVVVERQGRVTAYSSAVGFYGHTVAESNLDLEALLASTEAFGGPGILVPTRNAELFRWCLARGLRVVEPMTLMSMGLYNQPAGAYLPSILY